MSYWVIIFEDQDHKSEIFITEKAARHRLEQARESWACHLLVPDSELQATRAVVCQFKDATMDMNGDDISAAHEAAGKLGL